MDQKAIGEFIAKCRREKELTQAQLAERLNITDRAVSKWETGKCMPDSAVMLELCGMLGITVNELLSGEKVDMENVENRGNYQKKADENLIALKKRDEDNISLKMLVTIILSAAFLTGIMACAICDIAISGTFTWSPIPISSILFAWVVSLPVTLLGKRGIAGGLAALSVFVFPYLYGLSRLVGVRAVFSIGAVMSAVSLAYLWIIFAVFRRMRERKVTALGITFLAAIPFNLAANMILSRMIGGSVLDVWDVLAAFILLIMAFAAFVWEYARSRGLIRCL
ncbi:MAG: helix-turn-helix domain-containing protein [Eubacterium sp.]|nr:helix-turn-helix domain-containing protein [Eubacterium sp.]MCM1305403.1 helix-turn-helix domain-containing protein [Butyrivibrio sp.]MCM1345107.1 helix-turn-helix domain-containing protein [Muribaculaceae bacterium]MCM1412277.1 helix-turn-helix domain-containing protein [Lachnospiraceae bacterium]